jgi:hypothetical protein
MAHFAQVKNGIVQQVIVISDRDAPDPAPENSEPLGQAFIRDVLKLDGEWVQTSYNNTFRAHYAGIGYTWDDEYKVFYAPQPYPSWSLDEAWNWVAPVPYPDDGGLYTWNEDTLEWDEIQVSLTDSEDDGA